VAGRTALVVDDDDDVREVTKFALEVIGGWDVVDADGGAAALPLARTRQPAVILLDVMMPGMDGPATFRALRSDPRTSHIPVILLTAKVQVLADRSDDDGLAGVISKPFDPRGLVGEIDRILHEEEHRTRRSA
jgi:CheY-like chemotaxis protein